MSKLLGIGRYHFVDDPCCISHSTTLKPRVLHVVYQLGDGDIATLETLKVYPADLVSALGDRV